uniref:phage terminase small subunit P27 family n=1 Tax=Alistipes sp. TaxID=1872444 RepID=UPI004056E55D
MKGRKKLPDNIKALRGTDQPCRMTDKPAVHGATVIKLPKVGLKGTAKKVFAVVATELMHNNLLDVYGVDMVVAYAREMALYHDMMSDIEKEGVTIEVETKNGTVTQINPKRKVAEGALAAAKSLAVEFGMTPSSRSRVSAILNDNTPKDEFAEFEEVETD